MTPYKALHGVKPDTTKWRALGCKYWHFIPKKYYNKLDPHMVEGYFIGYSKNLYKIYNLKTKQIIKAWDIIFYKCSILLLPALTV
jgi:hypothetical protein